MYLATWATGAFYQAFVPALVSEELRTQSPLVLGLIFASYMASSAVGAAVSTRLSPVASQRIGMVAFLARMAGIVSAIVSGDGRCVYQVFQRSPTRTALTRSS